MSARLNCGDLNYRKQHKPKVHVLEGTDSPDGVAITKCNIWGIVGVSGDNSNRVLRSSGDHKFPIANSNSEVTCVRCLRKIHNCHPSNIPIRRRHRRARKGYRDELLSS